MMLQGCLSLLVANLLSLLFLLCLLSLCEMLCVLSLLWFECLQHGLALLTWTWVTEAWLDLYLWQLGCQR